jgi:hypothetical protein
MVAAGSLPPALCVGSLMGSSHANPSGSVKGPAPLAMRSRCDPEALWGDAGVLGQGTALVEPELDVFRGSSELDVCAGEALCHL